MADDAVERTTTHLWPGAAALGAVVLSTLPGWLVVTGIAAAGCLHDLWAYSNLLFDAGR